MAVSTEAKQHAHYLLDQLEVSQLHAVIRLLEVMILPEKDELTEEDRQAIIASREYFRRTPDGGVPFEQLVEECGFTMDEVRSRDGEG